jgi:type I restriction enzyme S subunit
MSKQIEWRRTTLGEALPIRYGKARTDKAGVVREETPVYGSSGLIAKFDRALTTGPALIIGRKGTVGATHYSAEPCWPIDTVYFAEAGEDKDLRFFKYLLDHLQLGRMDRSTAVPGLSRDDYNASEVAIPDITEQQRIVAEIEKQFTRLDAGVASLKRVQTALKRYRASVLKAACEGRLVPSEAELARKENRTYETGEQLLQRILKERREKWNHKGKYKEPAAPEPRRLPTLPDGWAWTRLEQIGFVFGGLTKNPARVKLPNQVPYLRVANVYADELRLNDVEVIGVRGSELEKLLLKTGDLLIVEGNGSKDQIGRLAIWDGSIDPCAHQNHVIKVRLVEARMARWVLYWLVSTDGRRFVELVASSTSGLYTLSVNKVANLPIPLPPMDEQQRMLAEIESLLSSAKQTQSTVVANLNRGSRLRASILQRSFPQQIV